MRFGDPRMQRRRLVATDRMDQPAAVVAEHAMDHAAERRIVLDADVLQHADGDERVVLAR